MFIYNFYVGCQQSLPVLRAPPLMFDGMAGTDLLLTGIFVLFVGMCHMASVLKHVSYFILHLINIKNQKYITKSNRVTDINIF